MAYADEYSWYYEQIIFQAMVEKRVFSWRSHKHTTKMTVNTWVMKLLIMVTCICLKTWLVNRLGSSCRADANFDQNTLDCHCVHKNIPFISLIFGLRSWKSIWFILSSGIIQCLPKMIKHDDDQIYFCICPFCDLDHWPRNSIWVVLLSWSMCARLD